MPIADPGTLHRLNAFELSLCRYCNRLANRALLALLRTVSWLGDWRIWVVLGLVIALLDGADSRQTLLRMASLAAVSIPLYVVLKRLLARERPYVAHAGIERLEVPMDRYSFPSGHTLHAVAFTVILAHHDPLLTWPLVPFTALVALSRVVLGVHYPSDVAAGGLLGGLLAACSLNL